MALGGISELINAFRRTTRGREFLVGIIALIPSLFKTGENEGLY